MHKQDVIKLFGTAKALADAMNITPQAVSDWPDELTLAIADRIRGACARLGIDASALESEGLRS